MELSKHSRPFAGPKARFWMKFPSRVQFTAAESASSSSADRFNRFEVSKAKCRSFSCWQLVAMKLTLNRQPLKTRPQRVCDSNAAEEVTPAPPADFAGV